MPLSDPESVKNEILFQLKWTLRSYRDLSKFLNEITESKHSSLWVTLAGCQFWMIQHIQYVLQHCSQLSNSSLVPKEDAKKIRTHPDLPKLAIAKTFDELQRLPRDLPRVFGFDGQVSQTRHALVARHDQSAAQPCRPGWINHFRWY